MNDQRRIDMEMTYSVQPCMDDRCLDPSPMLVECQRARRHFGDHASGWGSARVFWR